MYMSKNTDSVLLLLLLRCDVTMCKLYRCICTIYSQYQVQCALVIGTYVPLIVWFVVCDCVCVCVCVCGETDSFLASIRWLAQLGSLLFLECKL